MTKFSSQCARLEAALGAAFDPTYDTVDCCVWDNMPKRYKGYVWVVRRRDGDIITLGEKFTDALATATQLGGRRGGR